MALWTVYDHPSDAPEWFVARRWTITADGARTSDGEFVLAGDVEVIRDEMRHMGLTRIERAPSDDPVIMETWL